MKVLATLNLLWQSANVDYKSIRRFRKKVRCKVIHHVVKKVVLKRKRKRKTRQLGLLQGDQSEIKL
jgi:hypothetical protein